MSESITRRNEMRMEVMRDKLIDVEDMLLVSGNLFAGFDDDGDLFIENHFAPGVAIKSFVIIHRNGYLILHLFNIGAETGKLHLIEVLNEINSKLREGSFSLDDDRGLIFKSFIGYNDHINPKDIIRSYKVGIMTFLANMDEIMEAIGDFTDLKEEDFEIIDAEGSA